MKKETIDLTIKKEELKNIKSYLLEKRTPVHINELAQYIGLERTKHLRQQKIKVYGRKYRYNINDLIYMKLENKKFRLSKNNELVYNGEIVFRVVNKKYSPSLGYSLMEVDYEGEGEFRKIITILKKKKVTIEFPIAGDEGEEAPFYEGKDPRENEPPLPEKYLLRIRENLEKLLGDSKDFLNWGDYWIYKTQLFKIKPQEEVKIVRELEARNDSILTKEIKEDVLKIDKKEDIDEELILFSINYHLSLHQSFVCVSYDNWGRWNLKEFFENFKKREHIFKKPKKVDDFEKNKKEVENLAKEFLKNSKKKLKIDTNPLLLREVISGAFKLTKKELNLIGSKREIIIKDKDSGEDYKAFVFPYEKYVLGLKKYFKVNHIVPGVSLVLKFDGNIYYIDSIEEKKPSKVVVFDYNEDKKQFVEKANTTVYYSIFPYFKIVSGDLEKLFEVTEGKTVLSSLRHIFNEFGKESGQYKELHYLKAFHLLNILFNVSLLDTVKLLVGNSEFFDSEENPGIFILDTEKMKQREEEERKALLEKELKEKKEKLEKELLKQIVSKKDQKKEDATLPRDDIERQKEKIARRLQKIKSKGIVEPIHEKVPLRKKVKEERKEEKAKKIKPLKEKKVEKVEIKKVEKVEEKIEKVAPSKKKEAPEKKIIKEKKFVTKKKEKPKPTFVEPIKEEKESGEKKKRKKKVKTAVAKKKSAKRILEEELELKEAEKEAMEAMKEEIAIKVESKKKHIDEETTVVYSDKKSKKGSILGDKLKEILSKEKKDK